MALALPDKVIHLFDTFSGMPEETLLEIDGDHWSKYTRNSLEAVQAFLSGLDNFQFHPGVFPDTASEISPDERFCLVNIDLDIYCPTLAACEFFYPRMVIGGVMVLNDYRASMCKGATAAIDEFFADKSEEIIFEGVERTFVYKL